MKALLGVDAALPTRFQLYWQVHHVCMFLHIDQYYTTRMSYYGQSDSQCVWASELNNVLSSQISELRSAYLYFMLSRQRWLIRIFTVDLHKWRQRISIYIPLDNTPR